MRTFLKMRRVALPSAIAQITIAPLIGAGLAIAWNASAAIVSSDSQRNHAVIVGYGRVGSVVGSILERACVPFTVVEKDSRITEALHARKLPAFAPTPWLRASSMPLASEMLSRPHSRHGVPAAMRDGETTLNAPSRGFSAATICPSRSWI